MKNEQKGISDRGERQAQNLAHKTKTKEAGWNVKGKVESDVRNWRGRQRLDPEDPCRPW